MESVKPVNGEEMCICISCFCEATLSSGDSLVFFPSLQGSFVNKVKSGRAGGGESREDEVERKGKTSRQKK